MQSTESTNAPMVGATCMPSITSLTVEMTNDTAIKVPNGHKPRKNSEKRKAKSRDAARVRRSTESEIFHELCQLLPVPYDVSEQMDKISIIRLAASFLKTKSVLETYFKTPSNASGKAHINHDSDHCNGNGGTHLSYLSKLHVKFI